MRWRTIARTSSLVVGAFLVACANGNESTGDGPGDSGVGAPDDAAVDAVMGEGGGEGASGDAGLPDGQSGTADSGLAADTGGHDSAAGMDSSALADTGAADTRAPADTGALDSTVVSDSSVTDVVIPDVAVPPGTTVCDYLGNNGGNIAVYLAECAFFQSSASPCSNGCTGGCCGALCTNSSNEALCLPIPP